MYRTFGQRLETAGTEMLAIADPVMLPFYVIA